jgi:ABC-2 type transport system permease protein
MIHLLKIEWLKLKKYTAFKVLGLFFVIGVFATNYIVFSVNKNIVSTINTRGLISFSPYSFENTWQTSSYVTGFILLLPSLLLIMLFTNEYTYKTHRQNIIDGLSRQQFISVKIMLGLIFASIATIIVFINALIFGLASGTDFSFAGIEYVGYFFLKALSYNMIAVLFSVLIKRTGFATGVFFIYLGAENILSQYLVFLSMKLKNNSGVEVGNLGDYLPMNAADGLLTFPKNTITNMAKSVLPSDFTWLVIALAMAYLLLFYWWARRKFINSDL